MMASQKMPKYFVALHPSSLRRTQQYASFLRTGAPCLWAFLLSHPLESLFLIIKECVLPSRLRVALTLTEE